jgi:hypothetical protein
LSRHEKAPSERGFPDEEEEKKGWNSPGERERERERRERADDGTRTHDLLHGKRVVG